jgi:hypothetical protein
MVGLGAVRRTLGRFVRDSGLLNYTIQALSADGDLLCSTGGAVSFYTAPSEKKEPRPLCFIAKPI